MSNRLHFLTLLLVLTTFGIAGCSDDESITDPVDIPDPYSFLGQVEAIPGAVFAVGGRGEDGRIYVNEGVSWAEFGNQPADSIPGQTWEPIGIFPVSPTDIYLFNKSTGIHRLQQGQWIQQTMDAPLDQGQFIQTPSSLWCLSQAGILLRENEGTWNTYYDNTEPNSTLADVAENPDGTVFVSRFFPDQERGEVRRIGLDGTVVEDEFDLQVYALATTESDTAWAAGRRLSRFVDSSWDTVASIPDSNLVVKIIQPGDGSLTLVCQLGTIYSWRDGALTTVQEFELLAPLVSVCYINETTIYGSLTYIDQNTGHQTGIIIRFDGLQWITSFLVPPG